MNALERKTRNSSSSSSSIRRRNNNNLNNNNNKYVWICLKWANYLRFFFLQEKHWLFFFPHPFCYLTHHIFKVQTRLEKQTIFFSLSLSSRSLLLLLPLLLLMSMSLSSLFGYIHGILFSRWCCCMYDRIGRFVVDFFLFVYGISLCWCSSTTPNR